MPRRAAGLFIPIQNNPTDSVTDGQGAKKSHAALLVRPISGVRLCFAELPYTVINGPVEV